MWKKTVLYFAAFVIAVVYSTCLAVPSYAYTEEEKQQAKAWLSAHGYSPDAGGANQAYQDYLNGKFDDELGTNQAPDEPASEEVTEVVSESPDTEEKEAEHTKADAKTSEGSKAEGSGGTEERIQTEEVTSESTTEEVSTSEVTTQSSEVTTEIEEQTKESKSSVNWIAISAVLVVAVGLIFFLQRKR